MLKLRHVIRVLPIAKKRLMDEQGISALQKLCDTFKPSIIVEVGTLLAMGSTMVFAKEVAKRNGVVICVDPCDTGVGKALSRQEGHYHLLLSNLFQHPALLENTLLLRAKSLEAASMLGVKPDMVFIDGDHSKPAVIADINAWRQVLRSGGILCGDDYEMPTCEQVAPAVREALPEHKHDGRIWWAQMP